MVNDKKYAITQPQQSKLGGWFCKVLTDDQQTILFETFQPTSKMAFVDCMNWLLDFNEQNKASVEPKIEEKKEPEQNDGPIQPT